VTFKEHKPLHPGEFIKRVYIEPLDLNVNDIAEKLDITPDAFNNLLNCHSDVDRSMALKLSKVLGRSPESWLLMQDQFKKEIVNDD
jgi:addiction module HigA family antidote